MKRKTTFSAIGGYQPFMFCIGMYLAALFFSIFICSAVFYAINPKKTSSRQLNAATANSSSNQVLLTVAK
ncbi:MAG: hypothetical protein QM731_12940 [Chitinophagaceae bacterium]